MDSDESTLAEDIFKVLIKNRAEEKRDNIEWNSRNEQHVVHDVPAIVLQIQTPPAHLITRDLLQVEEKPVESVVAVNDNYETEQIDKETGVLHDLVLSEEIEDLHGISDSNCFQLWGNNWRQIFSVLPGVILLLSCGIQFSWTVRQVDLRGDTIFFTDNSSLQRYLARNNTESYTDLKFSRDIHFLNIVSWYLGAALGSVFGAILVSSFKKSSIYFISGLLLVGSAALLLSEGCFVIGGRGLFGFTNGILQLTVIVHVSDIAAKEMRSNIIRKIVYLIALSTFIWSVIIPKGPFPERNINAITAAWILPLAIIGIILTPILTNETAPYFLLRGKESKALKRFARLRSEKRASYATRKSFEELKLTVEEDRIIGKNIFGYGNLKPLFAILNGRLLNLLLRNVPLTLLNLGIYSSVPYLNRKSPSIFFMTHEILYVALGALALFFSSCLGGSRLFHILALILSGVVPGVLFFGSYLPSGTDSVQVIIIIVLFGLISLGVNVSDWIHTAQAFSVVKKPWSIAVVTLIEHAVHIALMVLYSSIRFHRTLSWVGLSGALFLITITLLIMTPKSTKLSLRDARNKFNKTTKRKFVTKNRD